MAPAAQQFVTGSLTVTSKAACTECIAQMEEHVLMCHACSP